MFFKVFTTLLWDFRYFKAEMAKTCLVKGDYSTAYEDCCLSQTIKPFRLITKTSKLRLTPTMKRSISPSQSHSDLLSFTM